ncbi:putative NUDIX domain containing protein [Lyophyllum shimeji]|uniref:NUDIX domain containing protein n=1 Tax=Lyophyllum shimeji TaxID=47721 RepID=A0A9P3Q0Q2_LYOSH|nr:putative NUDIX domain containing protein [Lyophyllum shimeji]
MRNMSMRTFKISPSVQSYDIPLRDLQSRYNEKRLVVGVAIIAPSAGPLSSYKLLLVQRSDTEDSFASMYELPGGGAEPEDRTILDTIARETAEETGLIVSRISRSFDGFEYSTRSGDAVQFNFVVEVVGGMDSPVTLNPAEHQAFAWVDDTDDMTKFGFTGAMSKVVADALKIARELEPKN